MCDTENSCFLFLLNCIFFILRTDNGWKRGAEYEKEDQLNKRSKFCQVILKMICVTMIRISTQIFFHNSHFYQRNCSDFDILRMQKQTYTLIPLSKTEPINVGASISVQLIKSKSSSDLFQIFYFPLQMLNHTQNVYLKIQALERK